MRVVRASSSSSSSSSSKPANRKERRKMEREMTTTLNTVEKSEMNLSSENDEKEEETTMESSNNNNNNNNVNFKLQKPKKRKVNKETYNDVVEKRRRESQEARTMNEASTSSSSLVIPSRDDVVASCTSTSTLILMLGLGARFVVPKLAEMNPLTLGLIKDGVDWKHACLASALAVGVTAGRVAFMSASEDFRKETNDSNKQVLTNLEFPDVLFCAAYPALAEEMLFRGALMPALGGGAVGVLVAGTVFGALHISGERKV